MICVIVGRGRHKSMQEEWKAAAEAGSDLVEIRVDCLRREPDLKRLLGERHSPVVFTARRGSDGGLWRGDEEKRLRLLREAIVAGVDYIDLELDIAEKIPRPKFGKTQRIISYHDFKGIPDDLDDLLGKAMEHDADIVKIAAVARTISDASKMLEFVARANKKVPTIGLAMGAVGTFTRVLGRKFGSPFTYAGFNPDRTFAPGMPNIDELSKDLAYDLIDSETEIYAVIGDPIAHSLSPAVHNAAFRHLGLNKVLMPIHIPEGTLPTALRALEWLNIRGMSVTIPHKSAIIPLLDSVDKAVDRVGACNTVVVRDDKKIGHNTDYRAAMASLEVALGGDPDDETSALTDKQVLVLGAGGVARAIVAGLVRRGAGVTICARDDKKSSALAEEFDCRSANWAARASALCDVLVNCTPIGMHPNVDSTPVPPAAFKPGILAFDAVYHPENTMFLKLAREHGCASLSGVDMFVRQAATQFRYYTGVDAPEDVLRAAVRRKLGATRE